MRSSRRSPFVSPPSLSYRLPIVTFLLAPLVSEIFDLKVAGKHTHTHTHTHTQNSTLSDNKGPLKLSAREPILQELADTTAVSHITRVCIAMTSVTLCTYSYENRTK